MNSRPFCHAVQFMACCWFWLHTERWPSLIKLSCAGLCLHSAASAKSWRGSWGCGDMLEGCRRGWEWECPWVLDRCAGCSCSCSCSWDRDWDRAGGWFCGPDPDKSTNAGATDDGCLAEESSGMEEEEEQECCTTVCSWGELFNDDGADQWEARGELWEAGSFRGSNSPGNTLFVLSGEDASGTRKDGGFCWLEQSTGACWVNRGGAGEQLCEDTLGGGVTAPGISSVEALWKRGLRRRVTSWSSWLTAVTWRERTLIWGRQIGRSKSPLLNFLALPLNKI